MKYLKLYYFVTVLVCMCIHVLGQDKIYYKENKIDECEVTEITPAFVKGTNLKNPLEAYSAIPSAVLFMFNKSGNFLVMSRLYDDQIKAEGYIKQFLSKGSNAYSQDDKIITSKNEIISCKLTAESEKTIEYIIDGKKASVPKAEVALVIYSDGNHKLIANVTKSFKTLSAIQDKYYGGAIPTVNTENHDKPIGVKNVALISTTGGPVEDPDTEASSVPLEPRKDVKVNVNLDPATLISLQHKAILNIKELETYLKIISDKDLDADQVNNAIGQAISLFVNEDAMIEVSSKNRSKIQLFKVRVYLNRLGFMRYSKVMIEWYDVQYVSKVRLNPDGTYSGIIEFQQKFTGMSGDKKIYEDITRKTVEIYLKSYTKKKGGENVQEWDVFLGNIGISVMEPER